MAGVVRVLGSIRAGVDREALPIANEQQRRLLAALVVARPTGLDVDRLVDRLWEDDERGDRPVAALRVHVNRLRARIGDVEGSLIVTTPGGYTLGDADVDVDTLADHVAAAAEELDPHRAIAALEAAASQWEGRPFGDLADLRWLRDEATRLTELWMAAEERRLELLLETGRHADAAVAAGRLLAEHVYRERLRELRALALYRSGRQAEALAELREHRARMQDDLGVDPHPRLGALERRILSHDEGLDDAGEKAGRPVRGYRLGPAAGSGLHSTVHRAAQPSVGRDVAVKVIRSEVANDPGFIRRFPRDASRVARLVHPHIVPLYDHWREPSRAFVVMPWMEGGSLADRLASTPPGPDELLRTVRQLAGALRHAHDRGVVHAAVKPSNVLFDADGNAYLADFGLSDDDADAARARDVADLAALVAGLARAVARSGSGGPETRRRLSTVVDEVADLLAGSGALDLDRLLAAVRSVDGEQAEPAVVDENPYRGLAAFDEADAGRFFGREDLVERIVEHTDQRWLTVVTGPSGVGKSSAVRAGVVSRLRDRGAGNVAVMVPGGDPWGALEQVLREVATDWPQHGVLPDALPDAVVAAGVERPLTLVVDQAEELYTLSSGDDSDRFHAFLGSAASAPEVVRVVLALRADHYDRPLASSIGDAVGASTIGIGALGSDGLTRAILEPARAHGVDVEPALLSELVDEVSGDAGALPLLQFALTQLWEARDGATLRLEDHRRLGGISGALQRRADEVFDASSPREQRGIRRLLGRLVTVDGALGRRRERLGRALELPDVDRAMVDRWVGARLLTLDRDPETRDPTVELSHEAIIDGWPRFHGWVAEDRAALLAAERLAVDAAEWERTDDPGLLYRGARLATVTALLDGDAVGLSESERRFVEASRAVADVAVAAAARAQRRRRWAVVAAVAAVAAVLFGSVAVVETRRTAAADRAEADRATLLNNANVLRTTRPDLAVLLAAEAYRRDPGPASQEALLTALQGVAGVSDVWTEPEYALGTSMAPCIAQVGPGRIVVQPMTGTGDARSEIVDIGLAARVVRRVDDSPVRCNVVTHPPDVVSDAPGGRIYVGTDADGALVTVAADGQTWGPFPELSTPVWGREGSPLAKDAGPGAAGPYHVIDPFTGELLGPPLFEAYAAWRAPDGSAILAATTRDRREVDGSVTEQFVLLDPITYEIVAELPANIVRRTVPVLSDGATHAAYANEQGELVVWARENAERRTLATGRAWHSVTISPDAERVAAVHSGATVEVRDALTGAVESVHTMAGPVSHLEWLGPRTVAALLGTGIVHVIDLDDGGLYETGPPCCSSDEFSYVVPHGEPGPFVYYGFPSTRSGLFHDLVTDDTQRVDMSAWVGSHRTVEHRLADRTAILTRAPFEVLWVGTDGQLLHREEPFGPDFGPPDALPGVASLDPFDPSDLIYAAPAEDPEELGYVDRMLLVHVDAEGRSIARGPWQVDLGEPADHVEVLSRGVLMVERSAGEGEAEIELLDLDDEVIATVTLPTPVGWVAVSADRRYVLAAHVADDSIRWIDLETGARQVLPINAEPRRPEMLADGRFLIQTREGQVELWHTEGPQRVGVLADPGPYAITEPAVHPDESHVWMILDGRWTRIPLAPEAWLSRACELAGRALTEEELRDFVPGADEVRGCGASGA
jgi:DNA-binding SARP family transcriptional activator